MYELENSNHMLQKGYTGTPTNLQVAIEQVGMDAVMKSFPGMGLGFCDVHGHYALPLQDSSEGMPLASCALCPPNLANGTSATDVELYINLDPAHNLGTNPQQKVTHIAEDVRGNHHIIPPTVPYNDNHREIVMPPKKD